MAFDNLGAFIDAGTKGGQASQSPFGYGAQNVMDLFKQGIENQMKLSQTAALFKGQKDYEFENSPANKEAQAKLNASGLGGGSYMGSGVSDDGSSGPPPAGSPFPGAGGGNSGSLGTNVPTKFTSVTGQEFTNPRAEVDKKAAEDLIAQRTNVQSNANAVDMLAELNKHYDNGMKNAMVHSDPDIESNPLAAWASSQAQGRSLDLTANKNPEWQLYQSFKKNTSFSTDRNLYDEKGKLIGQQLDAGVQGLSNGYDSNTTAHGKISTLFDMAARPIEVYNNKVRQTFGPNSQYEVHPKNEDYVSKTHAKYLALKSIQDGTGDAQKVKTAFKQNYGDDL